MQITLSGVLDTGFKLSVVIIFFLFISCKKENMGDCFKGTGNIITQQRNVEQLFKRIEVEDNIALVLTQSNEYSVKIEAGENLIDLIETDFDGDILTIRNNNKCNWVRSYTKPIIAHISLPYLLSLQYRSSGDVTATNIFQLDSTNIEVWGGAGSVNLNVDCRVAVYAIHTGTGDLNISGKTGVSYVWNSGNGFFYGENLNTVFTYISTRGTGDCYVNADIELGATILHIGDIYYKGNPEVNADIRGSGKLIKLN